MRERLRDEIYTIIMIFGTVLLIGGVLFRDLLLGVSGILLIAIGTPIALVLLEPRKEMTQKA